MKNKKQYIRPEVNGISFENLMDHDENVPSVASQNGRASSKEDNLSSDEEEDEQWGDNIWDN